MNRPCRPPPPILATARCTFKLHGPPLPAEAVRAVQGASSTWIDEATAGFIRSSPDGPAFSIFWWEERTLHRLRCDPRTTGWWPRPDALSVASAEELPALAREAESWTRHVLDGDPPSLAAYLADHRA